MDCSNMSDKEINKLVAFKLGCKEVVPDIFMSDDRRYEFDKPKNKSGNKFFFDPCNNPTDALPIIAENKISIMWMTEEKQWCAWANGEIEEGCWCWKYYPDDYMHSDNPLRAAMIVFLMMQESANVPANSTGSDIR